MRLSLVESSLALEHGAHAAEAAERVFVVLSQQSPVFLQRVAVVRLGLVESAPASDGPSGKSAEDQRSAAADRSKRERVNVHAKAYGQESVGLRVSIKWEGEGKWFKGVISRITGYGSNKRIDILCE